MNMHGYYSWQSELARPWLVPIIQGYVHIAELPVIFDDDLDSVMTSDNDHQMHMLDELKFKLCLISRRSRYRAGICFRWQFSTELQYMYLPIFAFLGIRHILSARQHYALHCVLKNNTDVAHYNFITHHTHTVVYCSSGICPGLPGWAGTRMVKPGGVKPIWIYWSKR